VRNGNSNSNSSARMELRNRTEQNRKCRCYSDSRTTGSNASTASQAAATTTVSTMRHECSMTGVPRTALADDRSALALACRNSVLFCAETRDSCSTPFCSAWDRVQTDIGLLLLLPFMVGVDTWSPQASTRMDVGRSRWVWQYHAGTGRF